MAAQVSHAALAANESTYGRCASGPSVTSAGRSHDVVVRIHPTCVMRADLAGGDYRGKCGSWDWAEMFILDAASEQLRRGGLDGG
jgi:hypothetical protein